MDELSCLHGSEEYAICSDDVLTAHLISLSRGVCACNTVYSVFKDHARKLSPLIYLKKNLAKPHPKIRIFLMKFLSSLSPC